MWSVSLAPPLDEQSQSDIGPRARRGTSTSRPWPVSCTCRCLLRRVSPRRCRTVCAREPQRYIRRAARRPFFAPGSFLRAGGVEMARPLTRRRSAQRLGSPAGDRVPRAGPRSCAHADRPPASHEAPPARLKEKRVVYDRNGLAARPRGPAGYDPPTVCAKLASVKGALPTLSLVPADTRPS